ncbi:MAG: CDP-diacylglycerol--glycerol-3-phosphate 3-phosphatidyltransferase [Myxococcota bacterium]
MTSSVWNIPNILTMLRIALIPAVISLVREDPDPEQAAWAAIVFVLAMLTDLLDGYLARAWDQASDLGAYLDPLADKLMVAAALIMLIPLGWVPAWLVFVLLAREMAITGLRGIASQKGLVLKAGTMGKIKTAFQTAALTALLFHYPVLSIDMHTVGTILLYVALLFSLTSATEYFLLYAQAAGTGEE